MFYPQEVIDEVRMGNDIVDVIGSYVKLKKSGSNYMGLCPFHKEKSPSFSVNSENQFYHCFGCGASGNVYSFLMQHENYSFPDAVKFLAQRINYTLPEATYSADYEYKKKLRANLYEIHKVAARFYYEKLMSHEGENAVKYLDERKISKNARIKYGLGYSPIAYGALYEHLTGKGFSDEDITKSGLVMKREDGSFRDKFFNRLMFPIIDVYGNIIGFGGRVIGKGEPKYLNSPETEIFNKSKNLYSLNLARLSKMRELILVEGYMDVISLYQAGFPNVVAALGTAFNDNHAKTLKAYADSIVLLFDSDNAGVNAVLRAIPVLDRVGIKTKVLQVTDAKDPDEYIKKFGASAFDRLLASARSKHSFLIDNAVAAHDLQTNEGRIGCANEIAAILSDIDNAIEADLYIKEAADATGISADAIIKVINSIKGEDTPTEIKPPEKPKNREIGTKRKVDEARRSLICIMTSNPFICEVLIEYINPKEFLNEFYITMAKAVFDLAKKGGSIMEANIVSRFEALEEQQLATDMFREKMVFSTDDALHKAVCDQLKIVKKAYIDEQMLTAQSAEDVLRLQKEKKKIDNLHIRF